MVNWGLHGDGEDDKQMGLAALFPQTVSVGLYELLAVAV